MALKLKLKDFKPVLSGFVFALPAAVILLIVKIFLYPRTFTDPFMIFKDFKDSLNLSTLIIIPTLLIFMTVLLVNNRRLTLIFSFLLSFILFWGMAYYINRVIFKDYFENTGFVGGLRVRLVFITPKIVLINAVLLTGFIILSWLVYKFLSLVFLKARKKGIVKKIASEGLIKKPFTAFAIIFFILINFLHIAFGNLILPLESASAGDSGHRVYLIGLDGADWDIIQPLLIQGRLPVFKRLISNGCRGVFLPPLAYAKSGPSWTSIATGLTVSKHGISDNSGYVEKPRVWNILDHYGRTVTTINWLCSPFAEKVNGAFISGPYDHLVSFPPGLIQEIIKQIGQYYPDVDSREISDRFLSSCFTVAEQQAKAVRYLLDKLNPDLLAVIFISSDRLQHFFWQFYEPSKFSIDTYSEAFKKYRNAIPDYYIMMDRLLGDILKKSDPERTTVILTADHGFEATPRKNITTNDIEINYLLQAIGLYRLDRNMNLERSGFYAEEKTNSGRPKRKVYYSSPLLREKLKKFFHSIRFKKDNESCFIDISAENDIFTLKMNTQIYELNTVNVIMEYDGKLYEYPLETFISRNELRTGDHRREGMFIISGAKIKKGGDLGYIKAYDIVPTILALMELPLAYDMDGVPLTDAFSPDFKEKYKRAYIRSYNFIEKKLINTEQHNRETLEKLRSLGYIN